MPEPLVLAVAQPLCRPHDVSANAAAHAASVLASAGARVVVFSELSLTGYELDATAITVNDDRLTPIVAACAETGSLALVGAPLDDGEGRVSIATLAIDGVGVSVAYRKMWVDSTEARFTAGREPAVIEVEGWRLGLAICKDAGIAEHVRQTAALGVDVYVAGTVMHAHETGMQNDRAVGIATRNQVRVAIASFAGSTGGGYRAAAGCSGIWGEDGSVLAQVGPETGAIARATLV